MELQDIERELQTRLDWMAKRDEAPIVDWLRVYEVLAQVKQAQALETIAGLLRNGIPVEQVQ